MRKNRPEFTVYGDQGVAKRIERIVRTDEIVKRLERRNHRR